MALFGKKSLNPGDPILTGGPGPDVFDAPAGNAGIDAFGGIDTVNFNFRLVDATITYAGPTVIIDTATSHTELTGVQRYVFTDGTVDENDGNALVDDLYYYSRNHDLWTANGDAEAHFAEFGWQEGRNPSAFFSTKLYLVANSDVRAAGVDPLQHFHEFGWKEGRLPSISFDTFQYLQNNPDVAAAGIDPLEHFLAFGREEGRASYISNFSVVGPSGFDEAYYLLHNPDVEAAGVDPLEHFRTFGWKEGRDPNAWFDTRGYLATYTDVAAAGVNPFEHYLQFGWKEGRNPLPAFDTEAYLLANPDVAAAGVNPLVHYLQFGVHEGRSALSEDFNTILNPVVLEGSATGTVLFPGLSWGNWISPLLSFTLTGDSSGGGFAVNSATGALTIANGSLIDFETSGGAHTLTVLAELGSLSKALTFTVGVTDAPPTISSNAPTGSILEGAANGTTVGITVTGSDPNGPAPIFTLANDAGGRFTIDASGVISVANGAAIDFETAPGHTYSLTARATVGALSADLLLTITVGDVNDNAPVFTSTAAPNVAENTAPVVALTTTDADTVGTNPPTFTITGGADQALFMIVGGNQLQFIGPRDFEVDAHGYAVQVTANDGANSTVQNLTVTLTDTDDNAPVFTSSGTPSVTENVTAVITLAASDADTVGGPVTFAITGGADAGLFQIVGNQLQFVSPRDFETQAHSYDVQVTASDSVPAHDTVQNLTVTLTDTNDTAPVFTSSATPSVAENTTAVVTLTATDADTVGGPTTFLITGGADQTLFQIVGGQLQFVAGRDFETQAHSYAVEVTANDGTNNTVQNLTVTLTDTNDSAPVFTSSATPSVAENTTAVVTLTATDADTVGGPTTFLITGGADQTLFQIVGGQLQFVAGRDFETQAHSYAVEVTANDGTNNTVQNLTVTLTDTNDSAPVFTSSATPSVAENTTAVVTLTATDADTVGGPTTFLITGGADQTLFQIVGGQLQFVAGRDFETQAHSYAVEVTANDGTNNTVQNLTVTLTDTNDSAPVFTSSATPSVAENTTAVVTLTATDADTVGGPTTFLITGGADQTLFQIVGGQLQFVAGRDFETQAHSYAVEVTANDGTNNTVQNLTVTLTDTNDSAPVFTSSATPSVAENTTAVVTLTATDADTVGGPTTFLITGGADQTLFQIVGGQLQFVAGRDFETQAHSYAVEVTANDGTNNTVQNLTVTLTDTNDSAPVFTSSATPSVAENTTAVVTLTATDADTVGGPTTFLITGGADQTLFQIVGGQLQFVAGRDFETQAHSYAVEVTANDGTNNTVQNLTVTLTDTNDSAPVFTSSATPSVAENTTAVVTLTATDADTVGGPTTFLITGGADQTLFQIVGGQLQFVAGRDFETQAHSYAVEVTANDGTNNTVQNLTVTLTDTNDSAPVFTSSATPSVAENTTAVVTLTATDADTVGGPTTFLITGGADQTLFQIVGGQLQFVAGRDFETQAHSYAVEVTANDGTNNTVQNLTVTLTDTNDSAPVFTSSATPSVAENTTAVVTLTATDADTVGGPTTFLITGGADQTLFQIVGGQLQFVAGRDFETQAHSYAVEVTANDGTNNTVQNLTVTLTDTNDSAPVFTSSATPSVAENTTAVVTLTATDADTVGGPTTFLITGGADQTLFQIVGGQLQFVAGRDFETQAHSYAVEVTANDGTNNTVQNLTVTLTNLAPVFAATPDSDLDPNQVSNGSGAGVSAQVDADASDPAGGTVTYALIDAGGLPANGGDRFTIDPSTGVITVSGVTPIVFDSGTPANNFFTVTVRASDPSGAATFENFTIEITPNAAPTITSNGGGPAAAVSMNENTTVTGVDVNANDPDNGPVTPLVYSIAPGGDGAQFTIDSGTGVLTFNSAPNFENPTDSDTNNTYVVTVRASDGAAFDDQTITITVNDVAEAPVIGSNGGGPTASITVNENQTAVTDVDATDPDLPAQTLTYSLVGGTDQAKFNINSGTGVLTFISAPNFESPTDSDTNNTYVVTVRASDGTLFDDQTITVTVANVNEQPTLAATGATIPYTEDTPSEDHAVTLFTGVAVSTVEPGQNLDQLILTVSNVVDTSERLSIDGSIVALTNGNSVGPTVNGLTASVAFSGTTATVTVSGGVSAAVMQTLIAGLAYSNTDESPTFGARVVTLVSLRDVGSNTPPNDNIFENIGIFSTVNVAPVNDAPVVTAPGAVNTFIEGAGLVTGTPVFVDTAFTVADTDNDNLASATISITAGLQTGDVLSFTPQFGITVTNAAPEILALSGSATKAQWQTVLRSITFATSTQDPTTSRTISIQISDGTSNSNIATKNVTITPVNDEPTLTATANGGGAVTFTETSLPTFPGSGSVDLFSSPAASTVEAGQTFAQMVLTVTNVADTTEYLTIGGTLVNLTHGNSEAVTVGAATGTASVSIAAGTATITVTPTTTFTAANVNALVDSLAYSNDDNSPTATTHTISVASLTDSGSNTSPNDNIGAPSVSTVVTVVPTNDAPIADDETFNGTNSAASNTALLVDDPSDGPPPDPAGPQKTITGDILAGDTDIDPVSPLTVTAETVTNAAGSITFQADGDFTYLPAPGFSGSAVFNYTLNDNDPLGNLTDTGTITINVPASPKIWYVNASAAPGGDGTSDNPFNSLTQLNGLTGDGTTGDDVDGANDIIFLYGGTYTGGITLEDGQQLISKSFGLTVSDGGAGNLTLEAAAAGNNALINGGVVLANNNTIQGIDFGNSGSASVFALSGGSIGNAVVNTVASGTINNTSGGAINITGGSGTGMNLQFTSVSSSGSSTNAIAFSNNTQGTFNAGGGTLTSATGNVVSITGNGATGGADNINFTYGGTINDDGGLLVNITGQTGGTKTFGGTLTDGAGAGGGINIGTSAGTFNFNGQVTLNTTTATAVNLTSNTGATINFNAAGNGLDITTTTGAGFSATGGGTVTVLDPSGLASNSIIAGSGVGLNISNTQIGSGHVTFEKISSGGGANNGITLDNTGTGAGNGGLHVTGLDGADLGTAPDAGSGGTIANKTGADGSNTSGIGIYLNNTKGVQLAGMQLNDFQNFAIKGNLVTDFRFTDSKITGTNGTNISGGFNEGSVSFIGVPTTGFGLAGNVAILDNEISGGAQRNVSIDNATGTMNLNFLRNNVHHTTDAVAPDDGFSLEADTSAIVVANISNNTFSNHKGDDFNLSLINNAVVDLTFNDNVITGSPNKLSAGIFILGASFNGSLEYDISRNNVQGANQGGAIFVNKGSGTGVFSGQIVDNVIGNPAIVGSGALQSVGIHASARGAGGSHTTLIDGNQVYQYFDRGIVLEAGEGSPTFVATVTDNTVSNFADAINSLHGIHFDFGILSGDNAQITIDVRNNLIANAGNEAQGGVDFRMRVAGSNDVFIAGYSGGDNSANAQAFIDGLNPAGTTFSVSKAAQGTYNNGPSSPLPGPNLPELPPAPLLAAEGGVAAANGDTLGDMIDSAALAWLANAAIVRWAAAGVSADQLAALDDMTITAADLSGDYLGMSEPGHVVIDSDAAGRGWFVDETPFDDVEFGNALSATRLQTDPAGPPAGHFDLLTTLMHEIGHSLGLDHTSDPGESDLMSGQLVTGERRLPSAADAAASANADTAAATQQGAGPGAVVSGADTPQPNEVRQKPGFVGHDIVGGFDAEYYLAHNPDVAAAGVDPLLHFDTFGWHEGRNPNVFFDAAGYLAHYADVATAGVNPLQHYEAFGWKEGRDPSASFDTQAYLAANPDVAAAQVNPLDHYLHFGVHEGRSQYSDGIWG